MNKHVYLLWYHAEDGPEELKATLDRSQLPSIAETYNADGWFDRIESDVMGNLKALLEIEDTELSEGDGMHSLMSGWGALHLQVVELK